MSDRPDPNATPFFKITNYVDASASNICGLIAYAHANNVGDVESLIKLDQSQLRSSVSPEVYEIFEQLRESFCKKVKRSLENKVTEAKIPDRSLSKKDLTTDTRLSTSNQNLIASKYAPQGEVQSVNLTETYHEGESYIKERHIKNYSVELIPDKRTITVNGKQLKCKFNPDNPRLKKHLDELYQIFTLHSQGIDIKEISARVEVKTLYIRAFLRRAGVLEVYKRENNMPDFLKDKETKKIGPNTAPTENPLSFFYKMDT